VIRIFRFLTSSCRLSLKRCYWFALPVIDASLDSEAAKNLALTFS
jgi:hypothetical protein